MRLTPRCLNLLRLLRTARWLTTAQIHRRFFAGATPDAVRKRLRKLTAHKYLYTIQPGRMDQSLFAVGPEGKRHLEMLDSFPVNVERKPPRQREHFTAINDLRIAAELAGGLTYFYAAWELPGVGWKHAIIPDALLAFGDKTFALEFDRGVEGVQFFVRTKMGAYERGFSGNPLSAVLIVTDRVPRMMALARAIGDQRAKVLLTTLALICGHSFLAPVFYREPGRWGVSLHDSLSSHSLPPTRDFGEPNIPAFSHLESLQPSLLRQKGVQDGKATHYRSGSAPLL